MKTIKICDKEYDIDCNAYTYLQFKQIFGCGLFKDIQTMKTFFAKQAETLAQLQSQNIEDEKLEEALNNKLLTYIDDYVEALTRLTYIFIYTANQNFMSYEEFMKDIPKLSIDDDWVIEVTEFAVEKFC